MKGLNEGILEVIKHNNWPNLLSLGMLHTKLTALISIQKDGKAQIKTVEEG